LAELGRPTFGPTVPFPDPFVELAFAAALTSRVRLGTAVVPLTSSHPLLLAKQAATLDVVSDGRMELGLGAGWLMEEAQVLGHPTDHPSGRLAEAIELLREAWRDGSFEWHGRYYSIPPVGSYPAPRQGAKLPLWIGGHGRAAERLAADSDAGLIVSRVSPAQVQQRRARQAGLRVGVTLTLHGGPEDWKRAVLAYAEAGTNLLILIRADEGPQLLDDLRRLADAVLPVIKRRAMSD
jgi:alkanesulfonate monooxygenase SsuD/methylene tetrahydromethanopterin reductase-like flavin-dependent oxidoreductase (luciferase family)